MATHQYDFIPGEEVYAVINGNCVKKAKVVQYVFETYILSDLDNLIVEDTQYLIEFDDNTSLWVESFDLFDNAQDALNAVNANL